MKNVEADANLPPLFKNPICLRKIRINCAHARDIANNGAGGAYLSFKTSSMTRIIPKADYLVPL